MENSNSSLLLTVAEQKNPLEHGRIIARLTTITPSTNVDKKQRTDKKHENIKAVKYIICVCMCLHVHT